MFSGLRRDVQAALERDPPARSALEVLPGVQLQRVAHWAWNRRLRLSARRLSHVKIASGDAGR